MNKIKCYKLEINGGYLIDENLDNIVEEGLSVGENIQSEIYLLEMDKDEYDNLEEFDGF